MTKLEQIAEALKNAGCTVEVNNLDSPFNEKELGFRYPKKCVYHWFNVWTDVTNEQQFTFKQSYSQNTGSVTKSFNAGWTVRQNVERLTGIKM